jgi:signal peptidase I
MEESKKDKFKRRFKILYKTICGFLIGILVFIGLFLVFYVVSGKAAEMKGHNPLVGLFTIISPSMTPNIKVYDVVLTLRVDKTNDIEVGDVITFYSTNAFYGGTPITHRVVDKLNIPEMGGIVFQTKGDANQKADNEKVPLDNVVGKVVMRLPQLGRLQFFLASKGGWIIAIMIPSLAIISYDIYKILKLLLLKNKLLSIRNRNI